MNAIQLISEERQSQIDKHGFTIEQDLRYTNNELVKAALFCIDPKLFEWPRTWDTMFGKNIAGKPELERIIYAASFLAARADCIISEQKQHS